MAAFLNQDDVTATLTGHLPACVLKRANHLLATESWKFGHRVNGTRRLRSHSQRHIDLTGFNRQGHALFGPNFQAESDGLANIGLRFGP